MKIHNVLCAVMLATSTVVVSGCNVTERMEDIGFKDGRNPVEKGTIKYNTLVDKDELCMREWANYESNLTRRAALIPQLVAVVQGSAQHERNTLTAVTEARAKATRPEIKLDPTTDDFSDPVKMAAFQRAQANLGTAMGRLLVANEKYPTLAASPQFHDLQVQIEGTENRLLRAREKYNDAVFEFNKELRHVNGKVINPLTGMEFKRRIPFSADESEKAVPKIDFNNK